MTRKGGLKVGQINDDRYLALSALAGIKWAARRRGLKLYTRQIVMILGGELMRSILKNVVGGRKKG